jgi:hypothetical protein
MAMRPIALVLITISAIAPSARAEAQSVYDATIRGASCKQNPAGAMNCEFIVGKDLKIAMADVGASDTGISFIRSNYEGDYYARFGVMHGCIIVAPGMRAPRPENAFEFAFISPKNGRVYRDWRECHATR